MPIDVTAAERFVLANARLLERHRIGDTPARPLQLARPRGPRAYRNDDGGFGHALEPDVRGPESEPAATLHALDVLAEVGALERPHGRRRRAWVGAIADADGGVPFVMPGAAETRMRRGWCRPTVAPSSRSRSRPCSRRRVRTGHGSSVPTAWCWAAIARPDDLHAYVVKFALGFLDAVPDAPRAAAVIESLRPHIRADGTMPVAGGTEHEHLTPLSISPRPGARSRALFSAEQIDADLDRLERGQGPDGGWTFDFLAWSEGQSVEWRGIVTVLALATLKAHGRLD